MGYFEEELKVNVDSEFKDLIPPLTREEYVGLEQSILVEGVRDPLVVWMPEDVLVDGHNRFDIAGKYKLEYQVREIEFKDKSHAKLWIIDNQLNRRNLGIFVKAELALKKKELISKQAKQRQRLSQGRGQKGVQISAEVKGETRDELAKIANVSHDTICKTEKIIDSRDENLINQCRKGEKTINKAYKEVKAKTKEKERETKIEEILEILPEVSERCQLINKPIEEVGAEIPDESVDWIITDPPYPKEYLPLYEQLSKFAERVLKPRGSLICMVGQSYLPQLTQLLGTHLTYQWILSYLTPGGQAVQLWDRKVNTFWKPLLWYVKGEYNGEWLGDVCKSDTNDNDKAYHKWGQSESGMGDIIERFTMVGDVICDPFCGAGTTGVVALQLNRKFIGIDKSEESIEKTKTRISEIR